MYESHVHSYETYIPYNSNIPSFKNHFWWEFSFDETQPTFAYYYICSLAYLYFSKFYTLFCTASANVRVTDINLGELGARSQT